MNRLCLLRRGKLSLERLAHWIYMLALLVLSIPVLQPLLSSRFTCGYDTVFHLWRAVQVKACLQAGILYARWAPDMAHGYGYPLFIFMPPLSAYLAALLNLAGLAWPLAINAVFILGILLGALWMYGLANEVVGGRSAGLVAAVAYLYAPFQAYDVFNRGSLSEALAWAFPPLVVWGIHRWSTYRRLSGLGAAVFGLAAWVLTHHLFAFLFIPLLVGWVLEESLWRHDWRVGLQGALAGALGLGVSAFFWLPALVERHWVQTQRLLGTWVFDFRYNFLDLVQLLAVPRVADPLLLNDWPPKSLGLVPALLSLVPLVRWRGLNPAARGRVLLLMLCGGGCALLTLPFTRPVWEHVPVLKYVQFPWRFLGPAAFCVALLTGFAVSNLSSPISESIAGMIILTLVLANLGWLYPARCDPPSDTTLAGMIAWERATDTFGTTAKGEYLPIWVRRFPSETVLTPEYGASGTAVRLPASLLPEGVRVLGANYEPLEAHIELESPVEFRARYLAFYYPGWQVRVDGVSVPVQPSDPEGLVSFVVPAGHHTVDVRFGETPLRMVSWLISGCTLTLLAIVGGLREWTVRRRI